MSSGAQGDTGATGAAGAKGDKGDTGAAGTTVYDFIIACSDETTALTINNAAVSFTVPRTFTLVGVGAYLKTPGSATTTVDLKVGGNVIGVTAISFQAGERGHKPLMDGINLRCDAGTELVIRITAAGANAAGLKYHIYGTL